MTETPDDDRMIGVVAEIMAIAAAADTRFPALESTTDPRLTAWVMLLGDVRPDDAREAVVRIARRPQLQVMQPGHLLDEIRAMRKERVKAVPDAALVPPDGLQPGQYPGWLRAARGHIADGRSVEYALEAADVEFGASRRMIGPTVKRELPALGRAV